MKSVVSAHDQMTNKPPYSLTWQTKRGEIWGGAPRLDKDDNEASFIEKCRHDRNDTPGAEYGKCGFGAICLARCQRRQTVFRRATAGIRASQTHSEGPRPVGTSIVFF